jgi:hypothetical protein
MTSRRWHDKLGEGTVGHDEISKATAIEVPALPSQRYQRRVNEQLLEPIGIWPRRIRQVVTLPGMNKLPLAKRYVSDDVAEAEHGLSSSSCTGSLLKSCRRRDTLRRRETAKRDTSAVVEANRRTERICAVCPEGAQAELHGDGVRCCQKLGYGRSSGVRRGFWIEASVVAVSVAL